MSLITSLIKGKPGQTTGGAGYTPPTAELGEIGRQSERFSRVDVEFWRENLAGAPSLLELPTDHPRPAVLSLAGDRVGLALTGQLTAGVRDLSERHSVTVFTSFLAGLSILLSRLSGQSDLVIGTPVPNRQPLALRIRLTPQPGVAELLAQVKTTSVHAHAHQDVPITEIVEALQLPCSLSYNPIFQVMLVVEGASEDTAVSGPFITNGELSQESIRAKFDLTLSIRDAGERLTGYLEYATDLFERGTVERMVTQLQAVLEAMVADDRPDGAPGLREADRAADSRLAALQLRNAELAAACTDADAAAAAARERIAFLEAEVQIHSEKSRERVSASGARRAEPRAKRGADRKRYAELDAARVRSEELLAAAHERITALETELAAAQVRSEERLAAARERIAALETETRRQAQPDSPGELPIPAPLENASVEAEAEHPHALEAEAAEEQVHMLVSIKGEPRIRHLLGERTTIGRTADNDMCIDTQFISRRHSLALRVGTHFVIEDLHSTNGTFVNGERVRRHTLKPGDLVTLGRTELRFSVDESGSTNRA